MRIEGIRYCGSLGDIEFLSRLYDLKSLPSNDSRFPSAVGDIWQHRENNFDWPDDWIFSDARFDLLGCADADYLAFLCETLHPVVVTAAEEADRLSKIYNEQLSSEGWELVPRKRIAGRAVFEARRIGEFHSQIGRAETAADILSSNWMQSEIKRINSSIDSDPALAIGTAKDLVESCCKAILHELEDAEKPQPKDDLPTLSKKMCKALGLVPEGIPEEAKGAATIKRTLSNLASLTQSVAELRGLYGSGHGRDGKYRGLEPRHARLAAACAIAFVDFATETYVKRREK